MFHETEPISQLGLFWDQHVKVKKLNGTEADTITKTYHDIIAEAKWPPN